MLYTPSINRMIKPPSVANAPSGSIRILSVVGCMQRGGVETWLLHILRHINRDRFAMDFLVHTTQPCDYDDDLRALGSRIIPCLHPSQPFTYAANFKRIVQQYGPYDIIHSHVHHYTGFILRLAQQAGIPVRIAHSQTDTSREEAKAGFTRQLYLALMKYWIKRYATLGLACSELAAADLFGPHWKNDPRWQLLYSGIDLSAFHRAIDGSALRAELGIPRNKFVIGHVGRFAVEKNHSFLVDVAAAVVEKEPEIHFLLVGDGALRPAIAQKIHQLGLTDHVTLAGIRSDVYPLMLGAMDTFLFPSFREGFGLVMIEAQAAGLPCIISDTIPAEATIVQPLVRRFSLAQSPAVWAEAVIAQRSATLPISRAEALTIVENSLFNINTMIPHLEAIYQESYQALT